MRIPFGPAVLLLLVSCTPLEDASAPAPGTQACLDLDRVAARRAEGPRTILFETAGGAWRNVLPEACPGLDRPSSFTTLVFEVKTGRLCRNDFVRVVDSNQLGTLGAGAFARCRLGDFTRVPGSTR